MTAHGPAQALLPGPHTTPPVASTGASRYANMLLIDAGKPLGLVCLTNQDGGYPFVGAPHALLDSERKELAHATYPAGKNLLAVHRRDARSWCFSLSAVLFHSACAERHPANQ